MIFLKQSTAVTLLIGPFLDESDGKTAETGLTISQADVRLSKNGGNMAQKNDATACTHDEIGYYTCPLNATDTDTLGILKVMVHESGALPVWVDCMVVPANVYDSLFSTDKLQTDAVEISGDSTAADDLELLVENSKGTDNKVLISSDDQDLSASLDVNTKTFESSLDLTTTMKASVDAECDEALTNYDPPTDTEMDNAFAALNDISGSDVQTAVDNRLDNANTELASVPDTASGLRNMIQFLFEYFRNKKTVTESTESLKKEDASTELGSATLSDDGTTFTKGEMN